MAGGYDKFFKEARKASGLTSGEPRFPLREEPKRGKKVRSTTETPEDRLRLELAQRMKNKRRATRKGRAKFPLYPALGTVVALIVCAIGYFKADAVESMITNITNITSRVEFGFLTQVNAAETAPPKAGPKTNAKEKEVSAKSPNEEKAAESQNSAKAAEGPNTKQWTQEELSFFSKLNERKKELDLREAELGKLEEELQKRKQELDNKLKQLEAIRTEISKTLKTRVASDQEKVDKLVQVYSTMKPQQASKVIESLDEDLAVEVLDKMKKKSAAEILNMMDAKKARKLSELLTGYQRSPSALKASDDETSDVKK